MLSAVQILSIAVFVIVMVLVVSEKIHRAVAALAGAVEVETRYNVCMLGRVTSDPFVKPETGRRGSAAACCPVWWALPSTCCCLRESWRLVCWREPSR